MKPSLAISAFVGLACMLLAGCRGGMPAEQPNFCARCMNPANKRMWRSKNDEVIGTITEPLGKFAKKNPGIWDMFDNGESYYCVKF